MTGRTSAPFGPWRPEIDSAERVARLREFRAVVLLILGERGADLVDMLRAAEADAVALDTARARFDGLAALHRRRMLAALAALGRPPRRSAR